MSAPDRKKERRGSVIGLSESMRDEPRKAPRDRDKSRRRQDSQGASRTQYQPRDDDDDEVEEHKRSIPRPLLQRTGSRPMNMPSSSNEYTRLDEYTHRSIDNMSRDFGNNLNLSNPTSRLENPTDVRSMTRPKPNCRDPNYRVHDGWEFQLGKVLKIFWSEPMGTAGNFSRGGTIEDPNVTETGQFAQKVRRFVIISPRKGHCLCLPIMTYQGRATKKGGVQPSDHAIIYSENEPILLKGENGRLKPSIKVNVSSSNHSLEMASRLNFAKISTIEYNARVCFIGTVAPESFNELIDTYNELNPPVRSQGHGSQPHVSSGSSRGPGPDLSGPSQDHYASNTQGSFAATRNPPAVPQSFAPPSQFPSSRLQPFGVSQMSSFQNPGLYQQSEISYPQQLPQQQAYNPYLPQPLPYDPSQSQGYQGNSQNQPQDPRDYNNSNNGQHGFDSYGNPYGPYPGRGR